MYKRQAADRATRPAAAPIDYDADLFAQLRALRAELAAEAVSYTHLTLPTSDLV